MAETEATKVARLKAKKCKLKSNLFLIVSILIVIYIDWRLAIGLLLLSMYVEYKIAWVLWDLQANLMDKPLIQAISLIDKIKRQKGKASEN